MKTRIFEITGVNVQNLSTREIVDQVVLPKILQPTGQDIRGWRIGDTYMNLIADFGQEFYRNDYFAGELLLEIAMQRISCGAVLHESTPITLPAGYEKYSVACDQYGLMSEGCWNFIKMQTDLCLQLPTTNNHMKKIIFGLVDHLTPEGEKLGGYMLGSIDYKLDGKIVYKFAMETLKKFVPFEELYQHWATPESYSKQAAFFKENWNLIDKKDFFKRIGKTGFFEKRKIKKEILG